MTEDWVFVVDENNAPLAPRLRSDAIKMRLWRRTGGGIALDKKRGLVLCHRRSPAKDERAGMWVAPFGGKSNPGESSAATAVRELHEEFGLAAQEKDVEFIACIKSEDRRQFEYVFVINIDSINIKIKIDHSEVAEIRWLKIADVIDKLRDDALWYSYGYETAILNSLKI